MGTVALKQLPRRLKLGAEVDQIGVAVGAARTERSHLSLKLVRGPVTVITIAVGGGPFVSSTLATLPL